MSAAPQPIMSARRVALFGALLMAMGPMAMTLFTPALPEVARTLNTTDASVKMTMTAYFGGFAFAQLVAGPISDAIGRRPVVFAFVSLFLVGTLGAVFATTVELLILSRFIQGLGASAGISISRALVRDVFEGDAASRIINMIGLILVAGPAFGPTIGALLMTVFGWRAVFVGMFLFGVAVAALVAFGMRETVRNPDRSRLGLRPLLRSYRVLLSSRYFIAAILVQAGIVGAIYTQATVLPFVMMERVGLTPTQFGLGMLLQSSGFLIGSISVRFLMPRLGGRRLVNIGMFPLALGSLAILSLLFIEPSYLGVMAPIALFSFSNAFVMPGNTTAAMAPFPEMAGAAAAFMGFTQMFLGMTFGTLAALFPNPVIGLALMTSLLGSVAVLAHIVARRMQSQPLVLPAVGE